MNGATRAGSDAPALASATKLLKALRSKKNGSSNSPAITRPPPLTDSERPVTPKASTWFWIAEGGATLDDVASGWPFAVCLTSWKFCRPKASGWEKVNCKAKLSAGAEVFWTRTS